MGSPSEFSDKKEVLTVHQLNNTARQLLETSFQLIWVKGELSNVAIPRSGHIYFTLKDEYAQVRCALFKGNSRNLDFTPKDGQAVLLRASVSIYPERGDYQLIVTHMEQWGLGQLQQAFEALKAKLQLEGLFDPRHKKGLPRYPRQIGIITSNTGAALQDILSVLKRRYPIAKVILYHSQVQGKIAATNIIRALEAANARPQVDAIIMARGGGSLEDLWCFNEENLARAIFASKIPIITGIGHEIDFTIADFVADVRAPTPSAAAEKLTPDSLELQAMISQLQTRLWQAMQQRLRNYSQQVDLLEKQLRHPGQILQQLFGHSEHLRQRLFLLIKSDLANKTHRLANLVGKLDALSPLATLARGYAIVNDTAGHVISDTKTVRINQTVQVRFQDGKLSANVISIEETFEPSN